MPIVTIETRAELNRQIKNMRKFLKEGAEELYTTEAGEEITIKIDQTLTQDSTGTMVYLQLEAMEVEKINIYVDGVRVID